jgi:hypothetical protein
VWDEKMLKGMVAVALLALSAQATSVEEAPKPLAMQSDPGIDELSCWRPGMARNIGIAELSCGALGR